MPDLTPLQCPAKVAQALGSDLLTEADLGWHHMAKSPPRAGVRQT